MTEDRGAAGPYIEYDGLPVLHRSEVKLPLIHPYAPVEAGRYVTPGGGRLTIRKAAKNAAHLRITLDHLGCPAQCTEEKNAAFKRLALAAEGYCVQAKCRLLTEREEKNSVAIASNESFGGWTKTFTDPRLCAAIVDRLTFNGTIIETGTDSYRLASTRARAEEPAKAG
ncbi:hypothetical protein GCM10010236_74850 [Streptomyces eurythermus]|nr:hypothetical protein GCM10010236_74850 [Streptomyces eurythermus]